MRLIRLLYYLPMEMTFFIPPVFLFGNNANRIPYDEEKKSEYKTAAETEIKVENWRAKRIAELEEENKKLKKERDLYKARNEELNENCFWLAKENEKLKSDLEQFSEAYKRYRDFEKEELADSCYDLEKENKKLKEELSKKNMETWFDEKAKNIYISQKENILMWKIC